MPACRSGEAYGCLCQVMDVNLKGVLFTAQAVGRQMIKLGTGGSIIFIASVAGHVALEVPPISPRSNPQSDSPTLCLRTQPDLLSVSYHSSKAALHQLARSMATEHAPNGIRVNTISPSYVATACVSHKVNM